MVGRFVGAEAAQRSQTLFRGVTANLAVECDLIGAGRSLAHPPAAPDGRPEDP